MTTDPLASLSLDELLNRAAAWGVGGTDQNRRKGADAIAELRRRFATAERERDEAREEIEALFARVLECAADYDVRMFGTDLVDAPKAVASLLAVYDAAVFVVEEWDNTISDYQAAHRALAAAVAAVKEGEA